MVISHEMNQFLYLMKNVLEFLEYKWNIFGFYFSFIDVYIYCYMFCLCFDFIAQMFGQARHLIDD